MAPSNKQQPKAKPLTLPQRFPHEFSIWVSMRQRCTNSNLKEYRYYGDRGIRVCAKWTGTNGFRNFINDMGPQPFKRASIERVDNDGNYTPRNVIWADAKTQARNMRTNRRITYAGETKPLAAWAELLGIKPGTLWARLKKGWSVGMALTKTVIKRARFTPWPPHRPRTVPRKGSRG